MIVWMPAFKKEPSWKAAFRRQLAGNLPRFGVLAIEETFESRLRHVANRYLPFKPPAGASAILAEADDAIYFRHSNLPLIAIVDERHGRDFHPRLPFGLTLGDRLLSDRHDRAREEALASADVLIATTDLLKSELVESFPDADIRTIYRGAISDEDQPDPIRTEHKVFDLMRPIAEKSRNDQWLTLSRSLVVFGSPLWSRGIQLLPDILDGSLPYSRIIWVGKTKPRDEPLLRTDRIDFCESEPLDWLRSFSMASNASPNTAENKTPGACYLLWPALTLDPEAEVLLAGAMRAGIPVLGFDTPGLRELMIDKSALEHVAKPGRLMPLNNLERMKLELSCSWNERTLALEIEAALNRFNAVAHEDKVASAYASMLYDFKPRTAKAGTRTTDYPQPAARSQKCC